MQAIYRYILAPCTNIYFSAYFPLLYQNSLVPIALIAPNEELKFHRTLIHNILLWVVQMDPSVTSERKTEESIFSEMEGIVLYNSLKRTTPVSCNFNKTTKAHLSPSHSSIGDAEQKS